MNLCPLSDALMAGLRSAERAQGWGQARPGQGCGWALPFICSQAGMGASPEAFPPRPSKGRWGGWLAEVVFVDSEFPAQP